MMADSEEKPINGGMEEKVEENELMEGMTVLDFDMLCATVALQTQGFSKEKWDKLEEEAIIPGDGTEIGGGVQRMWEGEVLDDCFVDRRIALETACCPCYRFGKNMGRAGFGSCIIQGTVYFLLAITALLNFIAFAVTMRRCFLYSAIAFIILAGTYLGFFRTQIRKQFHIRGSDSCLDDCVSHLICPCCTLCQESRTLEINNVQDGIWRGRGDTICVGSYGEGSKGFFELRQPPLIPTKFPDPCSMQRATNGGDHSWITDASQSEPLVPQVQE